MRSFATRELNSIASNVRTILAKVEIYDGSTLVNTFRENDRLIKLDIQRVGDNTKFFGFGICHRLNFHLIDLDRELDINTSHTIVVSFMANSAWNTNFPIFRVNEVHRDENTNELSITCYDRLYKASEFTVDELSIESYTLKTFVTKCATLLGLSVYNISDSAFNTSYPNGANFDGTETIREALDKVAEVTQTIYYLDYNNKLVFKRLSLTGNPVFTITKDKYITGSTKTNRRLVGICHCTELGDNVQANNELSGTIQYIRDNPFWDLRDDIGTLVSNGFARVENLTINQFSTSWRGTYALEIGDKIAITTKDDGTAVSYLLDDTIYYDGTFSESTQWQYQEEETETEANSASLGDALKMTYARVDKQNREITLLASQVDDTKNEITQMQLNTSSITASVQEVKEQTDTLGATVGQLTQQVSTKITSKEVELLISSELEDGVSKVTTTTGYVFDDEGLSISKTNSEMSTLISEDGMVVYRNNSAVLTANNEGVDAVNLHASTYLIIGTNSRFEDMGSSRTACYWIGG